MGELKLGKFKVKSICVGIWGFQYEIAPDFEVPELLHILDAFGVFRCRYELSSALL